MAFLAKFMESWGSLWMSGKSRSENTAPDWFEVDVKLDSVKS